MSGRKEVACNVSYWIIVYLVVHFLLDICDTWIFVNTDFKTEKKNNKKKNVLKKTLSANYMKTVMVSNASILPLQLNAFMSSGLASRTTYTNATCIFFISITSTARAIVDKRLDISVECATQYRLSKWQCSLDPIISHYIFFFLFST